MQGETEMNRREFIRSSTAAVALVGAGVRTGIAGESGPLSAKSTIPRRTLGKTGEKITVLILGGVAAMKDPPTASFHPAQLAEAALNAGINYFDTAAAYGDGQSERNYGEVLATRRKEVFLATKTGDRSYDGALRGVEASLKRLRTDHVDLLQVHGVSAKEDFARWDKPDGVMKALHKLRDEKVTRFIGVTGHEDAEAMRRAIELFEFDTVLTTFNPTARRLPFQQVVLPVAQKKGMGILAMKVMGGGLGSLAVGNPIKNDLDQYWYHDQAPRQAEAGTLIRYALGLGVSAVIVGMGSLEQLRVNVAAVRDGRPLDEARRKYLERHMA
jgi:aryl-alcohol dehydrogenase-like predicted oxidoreductase